MIRADTPMNMVYLHHLANNGERIIDVMGVGLLPSLFRMVVFLEGDGRREYVMEGSSEQFMSHYFEAMAFSGYGPHALGNYIHADICRRMKTDGVAYEDYSVGLSPECRQRIADRILQWSGYGYTFHDLPELSGIQFAIHRHSNESFFPTDRR